MEEGKEDEEDEAGEGVQGESSQGGQSSFEENHSLQRSMRLRVAQRRHCVEREWER